ncbi:MAG: DUF11 domain-containing protein [Actinobacteria bacterium]|nr:DUF11 domain-containing protein [Actinomycetota bacterium]
MSAASRTLLRLLLSFVLVVTGLIVAAPTTASAAGAITLSKTSDGTVLLGGNAGFTLTAGNAAGNPEQYNLSYTDTLPPGVAYVDGSTSPANFGEPEIITTEVVVDGTTYDQQTLVWANVSDLTPGSTIALHFAAEVDPKLYPIGSDVKNTATAVTSSDPREVPEFDPTGAPVPGVETVSASSSSTTAVTAIRITKASGVDGELTPEDELMRGVNDHQSVYSLTVTNNGVDKTDSVVVTDYLPAGLEFLGCGGDFNSTKPEYPGASNVVDDVAKCTEPKTVETVQDPKGYPAGVYTKVIWELDSIPASGKSVIRYAAGIPQRSNTMDFGGETPAIDGAQAANLDNNNGAATTETKNELGLTNYAEAAGNFEGAGVADTTNHTVTAEDLRIVKGVSPQTFSQGELATYTLVVDASEYANASKLVITDEMPAGLCPVQTSDPSYTPPVAECKIDQGEKPTNGSITGVIANADGSFTLTITPDKTSLDANGNLVITYQALMRQYYDVDSSAPTSAADSFTNTVRIDGVTVPPDTVNAPITDVQEVSDESSATILSGGPQLTKLRMANATPMSCSEKIGDYSDDPDDDTNPFAEGDRVCFFLRLDFPDAVDTRNAQLTDFLPLNLTYESSTVVTGKDLVAAMLPDTPTNYVQWQLGSGKPRVVPKGSVFEVVVSAIVSKPAPVTTPVKVLDKDNLAKFRYTNSAGLSQSLRDSVTVPLGPPPPIGIVKGVESLNGTTLDAGAPNNLDGVQVKGDDKVVFRIDVSNLASAGEINGDTILAPDVWDVLPDGITCANISTISDSGVCYDAGATGRPALASGNTTSAVIRWQLPADYTITPGATGKLTYTMAIPTGVSVSTTYTNTTAVASYTTATNIGGVSPAAVHNPANNVDAGVPSSAMDVPAASDYSWVYTADATVAKSNVTDITAIGNTASQAVVGETLTYTVSVKIPARTTVYNAVLVDPMPTGIDFVGPATAAFSATGTSPATGALPTGVTLTSTDGTLKFGTSYANTTDTDQLFEVKIPARANKDAGNTQGVTRTNTASFTSDTAQTGGTALPAREAQSDVTIVEPSPSLTKSATPTDVAGGQTVTYTLTASNAAGRPPLQDSWVVDCLPGTVTFGTFTTTPSGTTATTEAGTGTNGCATGYTRIAWNIGSLAGGQSLALKYTGIVNPAPAGAESYTNTATLTGGTLNDGKTDPLAADNPNERTYSDTRTATLNVTGATVIKSATPATLTPGQKGTWMVTATIPAGINFYDASVIDVLPDGFVLSSLTTDSVTCAPVGGGSCTVAGTSLTATNSGRTIGWFLGDLAVSAQVRTVTITYSGLLDPANAGNTAGTTRTNSATIQWNTTNHTDPTSTGDTWDKTSPAATATITVVEPALTVDKSVNDTTVEPGQTFTYTVKVANDGRAANLSAAYNYTVVDTVPTGVVVDAATISNGGVLAGAGANGGGTITWTVAGPLAPNASTSFTYSAKLAASSTLTTAALTNTADITKYESLPTGGRTYDGPSDSQAVTPAFPHVTPTKSVAAGPAYLGKPKTWTITVTNDGTATAYGVDVTDTLPMNWTYDAGSANASVAGAASTQVEPVLSTVAGKQVLTWTNAGTIPATGVNKTLVITFTATPKDPDAATDPGVGASVNHTNSVAVVAEDATGATGNSTGPYNAGPATASTHIDSADVQIVKTSDDAVAGQDLTYTLDVKNNGPDTAVGPFTVVDTLPTGLGTVTASGSGWTCTVSTTEVNCVRTTAADTLAANASFPSITVRIAIPSDVVSGTKIDNTATVTATTHDPDPTNNTSSVTDTVARSVDLGIVKKTTTNPVVAGQNITYTLDVTNHGPSDTDGPIVVTDDLPSGATFVSDTGTGWDCDRDGDTLTCTRTAGLTNGQAAPQITVVMSVPADRTASLTNTASVEGPEDDPNEDNDESTVTDPVTTSADLGLTKIHQGAFIPGSTGVYEFTVINNGPSDAAAPVRITDQLPAELTFVSDDSTAWDCSANASNLLTCTYSGSLADGATRSFTITVDIDSAQTGDITNTARVSSPTTDPHTPNNESTDSTGVDVKADLGIEKTHTGDATAGENLDFTLEVTNHGDSDSPGPLTVNDTLPTGMTFVSASGGGWSCDATGQAVTCTRTAGLVADATSTFTMTVKVDAGAGPATLTNYASVSGPAADTNPDNDTDTDAVTVKDSANVRISKTADATSVVAGEEVTYTLTVTNDGPSDADNVHVTDALPTGLVYDSVTSASFTCADADPIDCTLATMPAGAVRTITVTATVGSGVAEGATIENTANVSTSSPGDDPDDNEDSASIDVVTSADLSIEKTHSGGTILAGDNVTFDLAVHNAGPSDAIADVVVADTLPTGMSYVSNTGPWTCEAVDQTVTCTLDDDASVLADSDAPALTITALVAADLDPDSLVDGVLTNSAEVTSPTYDDNGDNNSDTDTVPIEFAADLSITKTHDAADVRVGDDLDFTLQVTNDGPSIAREVTVTDTLPDSLEYVSATGDGWTCTATGQEVDCTLDDPLAVGDATPITVTVTVLAAAYPSVDNTATVDATTPDPNDENNSSTDTVTVPPKVDLGITKTHEPEPMQVGQQATYTIGVSNAGDTDDPGPITVTDTLPDGLTYVSGTGDGWVCGNEGQGVSCTRAAGLGATENTSIALVVEVGPAAYPAVTNTATVSTPSEDTNTDNNADDDPATVLPLYDLSLDKELLRITGSRADWRLTVTNHGPNPAPSSAVVVTDNLPNELTYLDFTGDGWTCTPQGQAVVCTYDSELAAGASASVDLHTSIDSGASGTIVNSATIEDGVTDTATGKIPTANDGLAYTGGVASGVAVLGLICLAAGTLLLSRRRRRA